MTAFYFQLVKLPPAIMGLWLVRVAMSVDDGALRVLYNASRSPLLNIFASLLHPHRNTKLTCPPITGRFLDLSNRAIRVLDHQRVLSVPVLGAHQLAVDL